MKNLFNRFAKDESGATAIEYALIAALMAVALITATSTLGTGLNDGFKKIVDILKAVETPAAGT